MLGSAILLCDGNRWYIATAAHLIDHNTNSGAATSLCLGARPELHQLEGSFCTTDAPDGDRIKDRFDFAWHELSDDNKAAVPDLNPIPLSNVVDVTVPSDQGLYQILGYPVARNDHCDPTHVDNDNHKLRAILREEVLAAATPSSQIKERLQLSATHHVIMTRQKRIQHETGSAFLPNANGFSGGLVVKIDPSGAPTPVGMFTEWHREEALAIAIQLNVIAENFRENSAN